MQPIITCVVAGLQYLIHPQKLGSIEETINPDALLPVTLLTTDEIFGDLDGVLDLFDDYDDVFTPEFGSVLIEKPNQVLGNTDRLVPPGEPTERLIYHLDSVSSQIADFTGLPSGPYFLYGPNLYQAWRLYSDDLDAFSFGVIPGNLSKPEEFQVLTSLSSDGASKSIAVPSKLYRPRPSPRKPLSGIRISISDSISLKGTPTSLSSRAWASIHSSESKDTAKFARDLIDLGAVIVGKTKTSQLGTGAEWVDEQAPWSPRGDWYQIISGSSAGAATGLTGYKWLHRSIGSDDHGRSARHGVYSITTSPRSVSLDGILSTSRSDNVRLFSRSLGSLLRLTAAALDLNHPAPTLPKRLIYPTDLHSSGDDQANSLVNDFLAVLEKLLNIQVEHLSLEKIWDENPPSQADNETMRAYMEKAPFRSWSYEYYHTFDDFRSQYHKKFQRKPFIEATPQFLWNVGKAVSKDEYKDYLNRLKIYRNWFDKQIMPLDSTPNTEAIMILPCANSKTRFRDEPASPPTISGGVTPENLALILGVPHLAVPFTQVPYQSRISGRTEYNSVCVSLITNPGGEISMIQLVKDAFEGARWPTRVDTGRLAFPLKQTSQTVEDHDNLPTSQLQGTSDEL